MPGELTLRVDDLIGHPEKGRLLTGSIPVQLRLGDSRVSGEMRVEANVVGTIDGVQAEYSAAAEVELTCVRCLTEWVGPLFVEASQHFSRIPDEDGYAIVANEIDLAGPATDELALAIPAAPLCRPDCRGLCPICGTDLNSDPCGGHGDDSGSPFAALKDLFDP